MQYLSEKHCGLGDLPSNGGRNGKTGRLAQLMTRPKAEASPVGRSEELLKGRNDNAVHNRKPGVGCFSRGNAPSERNPSRLNRPRALSPTSEIAKPLR